MKPSILAIAVVVLAGCATPATDSERRIANEPLICGNPVQCKSYWGRAQTWIAQNSYWTIQAASESVISTATPEEHSIFLGYSATRLPRADGTEQITLQVRCRNIYGCKQDPAAQAAYFKRFVRAE